MLTAASSTHIVASSLHAVALRTHIVARVVLGSHSAISRQGLFHPTDHIVAYVDEPKVEASRVKKSIFFVCAWTGLTIDLEWLAFSSRVCYTLAANTVDVAQRQSAGLWNRWLRVQIPSSTP